MKLMIVSTNEDVGSLKRIIVELMTTAQQLCKVKKIIKNT